MLDVTPVTDSCGAPAHDEGIDPKEATMFQHVLVGADDSTSARQAVEAAADLAQLSGATLHIVTAYRSETVSPHDVPAEFGYTIFAAEALLQELSGIADRRGLEARLHAASGGAAAAVVRVAEQVEADVIVVGNKGMSGVRRVLGSVPNSVAHRAPCPVLIVDTASHASSNLAGTSR